VHAGDEDHTQPGWTTPRRGQDSRGRVNKNDREDRDKWRKYVHGVWPTLGSRTAKEQNRFYVHPKKRMVFLLLLLALYTNNQQYQLQQPALLVVIGTATG